MGRSVEQLEVEVLDLPAGERACLIQRLIASLDADEDEDPGEVERAWEEEIQRRLAEVEAGTAELIPAEEVFAKLRGERRR
jgi:putative addiction module component (TIGR02574 family)